MSVRLFVCVNCLFVRNVCACLFGCLLVGSFARLCVRVESVCLLVRFLVGLFVCAGSVYVCEFACLLL